MQMTKYFRILLAVAALAVIAFAFPTSASADIWGQMGNFIFRGVPAGGVETTVSTDTPILLKYVGSQSGTVAVAAGGDITLKVGASGSEAADTTLECPVSGALGGVIDVSDSACDTLGEVVDIINASANWRAVILDGLRTDSSNDTLATLSETANPTKLEGVGLLGDDAVSLTTTIALAACRDFSCGYLQSARGGTYFVDNPYRGLRQVIWKIVQQSTYSSGTSTLTIVDVDQQLAPTGSGQTAVGASTTRTLWSELAGNSATDKTWDFTATGFFGAPNHKLIARVTNSVALTATKWAVYGTSYPTAP